MKLPEWAWKGIAWVVSREPIANYIIKRSQRTPYFNLPGYMDRWWLFNPYSNDKNTPDEQRHVSQYPSLNNYRIHHILREDYARDKHNHPWRTARTIILKGWYLEDRDGTVVPRRKGDTATLDAEMFHNITQVSEGGVFTLFITGPYIQKWGFMTEAGFIPHEQYNNRGEA